MQNELIKEQRKHYRLLKINLAFTVIVGILEIVELLTIIYGQK